MNRTMSRVPRLEAGPADCSLLARFQGRQVSFDVVNQAIEPSLCNELRECPAWDTNFEARCRNLPIIKDDDHLAVMYLTFEDFVPGRKQLSQIGKGVGCVHTSIIHHKLGLFQLWDTTNLGFSPPRGIRWHGFEVWDDI